MESAFEDANVHGYQRLTASMTNDPKDRHVLAAAVRSGAHAIITHNVRHFPPASVKPYDVDVLTPDEFLVHQFHLDGELLVERLAAQAAAHGIALQSLLDRLRVHAPNCIKLLRV
jgi:hypothetical protein